MHNNLQLLLNESKMLLSHEHWQRFPVTDLYAEISPHPTFRSMRNSLLRPDAERALLLLRSRFGYLEDVEPSQSDEEDADFLTSEGVLLRPTTERVYPMASLLLNGYIRTSILPSKFSRTPSIAPPPHSIITHACSMSWKPSRSHSNALIKTPSAWPPFVLIKFHPLK